MEVCHPFEQDALRSRSDTQLLKIDLPYALSQKTLKVLRPVFEVIQERRPIFFNEKKTAVLRDILQQHFNAPHCLSDKKWKALLKQTINENNVDMFGLFLDTHPKAQSILQTDTQYTSDIVFPLADLKQSWVADTLQSLPPTQRLKIFEHHDLYSMWEQSEFDMFFSKGAKKVIHLSCEYCPEYVVNEIVRHFKDAVSQEEQMNAFKNVFSQVWNQVPNMFAFPTEHYNEEFISLCMNALSVPDQHIVLAQCEQENVLKVALTVPVMKARFENMHIQHHIGDASAIKPKSKM